MIPLIPFPLEKLKLTPLYIDQAELEKIRQASSAPAPLSKGQGGYHDLYFPDPQKSGLITFASIVLSIDGKIASPITPSARLWHAPTISIRGAPDGFLDPHLLTAHADALIVGARLPSRGAQFDLRLPGEDLLAERRTILGKAPKYP